MRTASPPPLPHRWWAWLAACLLSLAAQPLAAQASAARESAVKAAFLYQFANYVEWPAGTFQRPEDPLVIGVVGQDAIAADLEQIAAGRPADGRAVVVRRLRGGDVATGVHVLMVGAAPAARVRDVAQGAAGPVLVVTEQDGGLGLGGILNFSFDGARVRFSASLPAAEARNLRLSARLLAVAQAVERAR
ncbi:MAG TPA: YfiR family protein [Ramlibacter sp.]|nr:YfiR family protein [Ramlibacter sp.]